MKPTIVGRSSSHFTRCARIFAAELGVDHDFEVVHDLLSAEPAAYASNPALRLPILRTSNGVWFGALGICRELARRSKLGRELVWPEDLETPLLANAQELALQAMASEVTLIMAKLTQVAESNALLAKLRRGLESSLIWLNAELPEVLASLPAQRELSFLEVSVFCLVTHLQFRAVLDTAGYANLTAFCAAFGARPSALATTYRFDAPIS